MDSAQSGQSLTGQLDNRLYNLRVELNASIDAYSLSGEVQEEEEGAKTRKHVSKFKKHLDRVMQSMETEECQQDLIAIEDYYDEVQTTSIDDANSRSGENNLAMVDNSASSITIQNPEELEETEDSQQKAAASNNREHIAPRNKYLSKLAYAGVWNPSSKNSQTKAKSTQLTIFDWDDTLFPTSAFSPKTPDEMAIMAEQNVELFEQIDAVAYSLLMKTLEDKQ